MPGRLPAPGITGTTVTVGPPEVPPPAGGADPPDAPPPSVEGADPPDGGLPAGSPPADWVPPDGCPPEDEPAGGCPPDDVEGRHRLADPMRTRPRTATPADPRSKHHLARPMTGTPAGPKTEHHLARRMTGSPAGPKTECHLARRTRGCHPIGAARCRNSRRRTPAMGCHRSVARWTGSALPTGWTGWKCCRPTTRFAAVPARGTGSPGSVPGSPARPTARAATSRGCRRTNSATRVKTMGTRARRRRGGDEDGGAGIPDVWLSILQPVTTTRLAREPSIQNLVWVFIT